MEHRDFIKLSKRLLMSASMVTKGNVVADIGCDHAHTDIYLVKEDIAPRAIAMDVGEGPLSHARANIKLFGLSEKIETRLSDGLEMLEANEADTLIIAGMGGTLTTLILEKKPEVVASLKELILQPQSDPALVRRLIKKMGFEIVCEDMCIEDGKFYNTMKAMRSAGTTNELGDNSDSSRPAAETLGLEILSAGIGDNAEDTLTNEMYDEFGKYLLERRHPVLKELLLNLQKKNIKVLEKIKESGGDSSMEKIQYFEREKLIIEKALGFYNM